MLHVDIPTRPDFAALNRHRGDACVSIYLETTPVSQHADAGRIELGNLARQAASQLEAVAFDKRRLAELMDHVDALVEDDAFWRLQATSLAVLLTPESIRTFRLANRLSPAVEVSDRFHLKPLLRAIAFPHAAFVLAISENAVRLIEVFAQVPPRLIRVEDMPKDAADAVGKSTLNNRSPQGRIHGTEGQNVRLRQYARQVDATIRPALAGRETPLILAAQTRMDAIYRAFNSYPHLLPEGLSGSPDKMTDAELAEACRPVLDEAYKRELADFNALYEARMSDGRATADLTDAARAATYGAIDTLLVDIDNEIPGEIDEATGAVIFSQESNASSYDIVDEIAGRAFANGAKVYGVRKEDLPVAAELAAVLRFAI